MSMTICKKAWFVNICNRIYKKLSSWLYISDEELKEDLKKNCENTMEITEELLQRARTMFINLIDNAF